MRPILTPARSANVLDGLSDRMRAAVVLCDFDLERGKLLARTALMDVVLRGARALSPERRGNHRKAVR